MNHYLLTGIAACLSLTASVSVVQAQEKVQAHQLVEIFEQMSGKHPGFRKAHARGLCAAATFTPNTDSPFASAALLSNGELPVTMRFSLGGGNPNSDERAPGTRGMGMQIRLPDGGQHMFTGNNFPAFAGKDPDVFYGFLKTLLPDENGVRDPSRTLAYIKANPSVQAHAMWQQQAKTPASYANTQFFGLHTFYFDPQGADRIKFRWELVPALGVKTLNKEEAAALPEAFLADTMSKQLKEGKVAYTLQVSIGQPQDTDVDPSSPWPADRPTVALGEVTIQSAGSNTCTPMNFDPNIMSNGFSPSADPILQMRSPAYAVSFGKRLSGQ